MDAALTMLEDVACPEHAAPTLQAAAKTPSTTQSMGHEAQSKIPIPSGVVMATAISTPPPSLIQGVQRYIPFSLGTASIRYNASRGKGTFKMFHVLLLAYVDYQNHVFNQNLIEKTRMPDNPNSQGPSVHISSFRLHVRIYLSDNVVCMRNQKRKHTHPRVCEKHHQPKQLNPAEQAFVTPAF